MPNIEDFIKFKKKPYRSWDPDLLEKLKIRPRKEKAGRHIENWITTVHKPYTNPEQTVSKPLEESNEAETGDKLGTNRRQTGDKLGTNRGQTGDKQRANRRQTGDAIGDKTGDKQETNWGQTGDKRETNTPETMSFNSLSGVQKNIVIFIYDLCKFSQNNATQPISVEHISSECKTTKSSVKKSIQRLVQKKIIFRESHKIGRGGWTSYGLSRHVFQEILHRETTMRLEVNRGQTGDKQGTNWRQTEDKLGTQWGTEQETTPPSSSSNINISTTTELTEEWSKIDLSHLESINFTKGYLKQLQNHPGKLTPESVQESIDHFAFDLKYNDKRKSIKKDPIAFFITILKKEGMYMPPENYESPQLIALKLYKERKETLAKEQAKVEEGIQHLHFLEWRKDLTQEEAMSYIPEELRGFRPEKIEQFLQEHYAETLWAEKRKMVLTELFKQGEVA